jgi:hypothetical protein
MSTTHERNRGTPDARTTTASGSDAPVGIPPSPQGWGPPPSPASTPPSASGQWGPPPQPGGPGAPQPGGPGGHQPGVPQPGGFSQGGQQPGHPTAPGAWQHRGQVPPGYVPPAQAPAAAGTAADDKPPSVGVLLGATLWRLGIAGLALYYAQTGKDDTMSSESLSYLSNVGVGIGFFLLAVYPFLVGGRRHEPRTAWLRGALTVMMILVGLVFVIGMGETADGPHAVIPALVTFDFLFVGRSQFRTRWWEPPTWSAFLLVYLWYHQSNDVPLYEDILGEDKIGTMVPAFLAGCIVLGYLLLGANLIRRAAIGAGRQ